MTGQIDGLSRFVHAVAATGTMDEAVGVLHDALAGMGFHGLVYGHSRAPRRHDGSWTSVPLVTRNIPHNWMVDWSTHSPNDPFLHLSYFGRDVEWSEVRAERRQLTADERVCLDYISDAGLHYGLTIAIRQPRRYAGMSVFGGAEQVKYWTEMVEKRRPIVKLLFHYFDNVVASRFPERPDAPDLSAREAECLHWCAQGKTVDDIGTILGISPETVRIYMKRINHKLGTVNRSHAIAKAAALGLIDVLD